MASDSKPTPRAPFDDADADIIFRSSDGVLFNLYKNIVAKASSVMRDMLTLPDDGLPQTVDLTESATTLDGLFRLFCPVERPTFSSLDDADAVLAAAVKYDMPVAIANLCPSLRLLMVSDPLRLYAMAYKRRLEDLVRESAKLLVRDSTFHVRQNPPAEFDDIPAIALHNLTVYRVTCSKKARALVQDRQWPLSGDHRMAVSRGGTPGNGVDISGSWVWANTQPYAHSESCCPGSIILSYALRDGNAAAVHAQKWWCKYINSLADAVGRCPCGETVRSFFPTPASQKALKNAWGCPACLCHAPSDVQCFNELLAQRVDDELDKVELKVAFAAGRAVTGTEKVGT
ncbi:uncharacterized protein BXZ73DRAFT_97806 [Epithele typhae]|uniref:uncharacterized protein n=1 Tax=Epithele typhae TaxID=378194 RepID=UPI0020073639|nr:uncharacterized protein BXZ73DRAFT_97806 [Epithele typhae]KAH9942394.1 hypothetical protein BXZ73DRAFT_97806 [Epithele typhae]